MIGNNVTFLGDNDAAASGFGLYFPALAVINFDRADADKRWTHGRNGPFELLALWLGNLPSAGGRCRSEQATSYEQNTNWEREQFLMASQLHHPDCKHVSEFVTANRVFLFVIHSAIYYKTKLQKQCRACGKHSRAVSLYASTHPKKRTTAPRGRGAAFPERRERECLYTIIDAPFGPNVP